MAISIRPYDTGFAAEVSGIDLTAPLAPADVAAIDKGMDDFGVLVFHGQRLDDDAQLAFTRNFGELEISSGAEMSKPGEMRLRPEIADISNLDERERIRGADDKKRLIGLGNRLWHSDASFRAVPAKYSLLSARVVPARGGETQFADMRAAYDALDDETKAEIEHLVARHSNAYSRELIGFPAADYGAENQDKLRPVRHPLVRFDPRTGRKTLYLSAHIGEIEGWPTPEARAFLRDLMEHATEPRFVHTHAWKPWDLVMWDNRTTMHRARRYDDRNEIRDMRRSTVRGEGTTIEQLQRAA